MTRTRIARRITAAAAATLLLAVGLPVAPAVAVEPPLDVVSQQVFGSDAVPNGNVGFSADAWGDTAIVGSYDANAVWVYARRGGVWFEEQKLVPSDTSSAGGFGYSVAISGDMALVGAWRDDEQGVNAGAAYVFTRSAGHWTQRAKLIADDGGATRQLGLAVAVSGGTALVCAYGPADGYRGAVYVFTGSDGSWGQRQKLTIPGGASGDLFGDSLALEDGTAFIGAPGRDGGKGTAYVVTRNGGAWDLPREITAPGSAIGDDFGTSVALSGGTALVGAPGGNGGKGAAYVFTGSGSSWAYRQTLLGSGGAVGDLFGRSVDMAGGAALVGASGRASGRGAAYLFTGSGNAWTERHCFADALGEPNDNFGQAVALSGGTALVGAPHDDTAVGGYAGSAWFCSFSHPLTPGVVRIAGENRYATAVAASKRCFPAGAPAVVVATGASWPDALGGSALAGAAHGPLLLTKKDALPAEVAAEIRRLGAVRAYVLGSSAAVGSGVENTLVSMLGRANVVRLGGANRYETAHLVADEAIRMRAFTFTGTVMVTTGRNYPDATAASPVAALLGAPVLLVNPAEAEVALPPGTMKAVVLGSTAAVPAPIETYLVNRLGRDNVWRQGGANRYATAAQLAFLASFFGVKADAIGLATGTNFPDALTAGPMLARSASALVLTRPTVLPEETKALLQAGSSQLKSMFIFGDYNAVSAAVEAAAKAAAGIP